MVLYFLLLSVMERKSAVFAPKRQAAEAKMVETVLEQLQDMSIIKSFNLTGKGDQKVRQALEDSRSSNLGIEKLFTPYIMAQEMVLQRSNVLILIATVAFFLNRTISLANALMAVIVAFLIFPRSSLRAAAYPPCGW